MYVRRGYLRRRWRGARRAAVPAGTRIIIHNDPELMVVAFNLVDDRTEVNVLPGFDFDGHRSNSLGLLLVDELACSAIDQGRQVLDLMIGNEQQKAVFEARPQAMRTVRGAGSLRGLLAHMGQAQVALARRTAKRLPTSRGLLL